MVASMEVHKDQDTLLHALAELHRRGTAARLRLVGSGTRADSLRHLARKLSIDDLVDWVGTVDNVLAELERMDVFAYAVHDQEGLGIALVEAMAAGLPVVGADVRACREVLEDGRLGPLIPGRDPAAWADALPLAAQQGPVPVDALAPYSIAHTWQAYQDALQGMLP
jgi:glycosyltransferase involved in cell wall biosynthesis